MSRATDAPTPAPAPAPTPALTPAPVPAPAVPHPRSLFQRSPRARRRAAAEARFRALGAVAVSVALACLVLLLATIVLRGLPGFTQARITLPVHLDAAVLDPQGNRDPAQMAKVTTLKYGPLFQAALAALAAGHGLDQPGAPQRVAGILSTGSAAQVRAAVLADPSLVGQTVEFELLASSRIDGYLKGRVSRASIADDGNISLAQLDLADALLESGRLTRTLNLDLLTGADASESRPEAAGFGVSILGSLYMMLVVLGLALPVAVAAAVWLEEFAPVNRLTDLIEVNIANLAAVPSIVFGILGLAAFIQFAGLPQSAPLVGGLVLALMTLPTIIISTRAALKAVPPSIREAALGVGASPMQTVFHHVLPLALPGVLTGVILGLAQALGETAPLLLIGMVGFVATNPPAGLVEGFVSPNSAMPAQIYEWARRADPAWYERAWAGIIILLLFMLAMNLAAILLRRRFERRW